MDRKRLGNIIIFLSTLFMTLYYFIILIGMTSQSYFGFISEENIFPIGIALAGLIFSVYILFVYVKGQRSKVKSLLVANFIIAFVGFLIEWDLVRATGQGTWWNACYPLLELIDERCAM